MFSPKMQKIASVLSATTAYMLVIFCIFSLFSYHGHAGAVAYAPDSIENAIGAVSILGNERFGFTLNHFFHPSRYQPWFSATVLLPFVILGGADPLWGIYGIFFFSALLLLMMFLAGKKYGYACGILACSLLFLLSPFRHYSQAVMTEIPYCALLFAMLLLYLRMWQREKAGLLQFFFFGLLTAWCGSIRVTAFPMLLLPFLLLFRKKIYALSEKLYALLLLSVPSFGIIAATLLRNRELFGSFFRTGYSYWCPVPYDVPGMVFNLRYIPENIADILQTPWGWYALALILVSTVFMIVQYRKKNLDSPPEDFFPAFLFAGFQTLVLLLLYLPYFFHEANRLLIPIPVLFAFPAAISIRDVLRKHPVPLRILAAVSAVISIIAGIYFSPGPASRERDIAFFQTANHVLPDDALLIVLSDCALAEFYFHGENRRIIPFTRMQEYAGKIIALCHPGKLDPPPRSPSDHLAAALIGNPVCRTPYPFAAADSAGKFEKLIQTGRVWISGEEYAFLCSTEYRLFFQRKKTETIRKNGMDFVHFTGK